MKKILITMMMFALVFFFSIDSKAKDAVSFSQSVKEIKNKLKISEKDKKEIINKTKKNIENNTKGVAGIKDIKKTLAEDVKGVLNKKNVASENKNENEKNSNEEPEEHEESEEHEDFVNKVVAPIKHVNSHVATSTEVSTSTNNYRYATCPSTVFARNLNLASQGYDVGALQNFLYSGFVRNTIASSSTGYFASSTSYALSSYQNYRNISPANGVFTDITRALITNECTGGTNTSTSSNATSTTATSTVATSTVATSTATTTTVYATGSVASTSPNTLVTGALAIAIYDNYDDRYVWIMSNVKSQIYMLEKLSSSLPRYKTASSSVQLAIVRNKILSFKNMALTIESKLSAYKNTLYSGVNSKQSIIDKIVSLRIEAETLLKAERSYYRSIK